MTPLSLDITDNANICDGGDQKRLKPKSKCGEGFHVETAFDYKGISSHERIGYGECATGKCGFG